MGGMSSRRMGRQMRRQKIEKIKLIVALGDRWTTNSTQQPTKNMQARQRVTYWTLDARPDGEVRGARSHRFWGDRVGRRVKNELK